MLTKKEVIRINEKVGKEFNTEYGLLNNGNLDYALICDDPYLVALNILRCHPFLDGNKRTSFMVYMLLTTTRDYDSILKDYYDILLSLSK